YVTWFTASRLELPRGAGRAYPPAHLAGDLPGVRASGLHDRGSGRFADGTYGTRKFTYFSSFGLTSSWLRPTVTVRNHHSKRRLAREPRQCHLSTPRHSVRACALSAPSKGFPSMGWRRSPVAAGRRWSWAPTSAATAP